MTTGMTEVTEGMNKRTEMTQNKTIQEVIETTDIRTDDGTTKTFPQYVSQHILINDHVLIIIVLNAASL